MIKETQKRIAEPKAIAGAVFLVFLWMLYPLAKVSLYLATTKYGVRLPSDDALAFVLMALTVGAFLPLGQFLDEMSSRWNFHTDLLRAVQRLPLFIAAAVTFAAVPNLAAVPILVASAFLTSSRLYEVFEGQASAGAQGISLSWDGRVRLAIIVASSGATLMAITVITQHLHGVRVDAPFFIVSGAATVIQTLRTLGVKDSGRPEAAAIRLADQPELLSYLQSLYLVAKIALPLGIFWAFWELKFRASQLAFDLRMLMLG